MDPKTEDHCPKCRRQRWDSETSTLPINVDQCESTGSVSCRLTTNQNSLIAALKSVLNVPLVATLINDPDKRADRLVIRTALAVVEHLRPSSTTCPKCGAIQVIKNSEVQPHYARHEDMKLCPAAFGTVLGGVWLEKL